MSYDGIMPQVGWDCSCNPSYYALMLPGFYAGDVVEDSPSKKHRQHKQQQPGAGTGLSRGMCSSAVMTSSSGYGLRPKRLTLSAASISQNSQDSSSTGITVHRTRAVSLSQSLQQSQATVDSSSQAQQQQQQPVARGPGHKQETLRQTLSGGAQRCGSRSVIQRVAAPAAREQHSNFGREVCTPELPQPSSAHISSSRSSTGGNVGRGSSQPIQPTGRRAAGNAASSRVVRTATGGHDTAGLQRVPQKDTAGHHDQAWDAGTDKPDLVLIGSTNETQLPNTSRSADLKSQFKQCRGRPAGRVKTSS